MRKFKDINMSKYTSELTILRHFLKIFSMIHNYAPQTHCKCWLRHWHYLYVRNEHFK